MTDSVMPELSKDTYTREEVEALLQDVLAKAHPQKPKSPSGHDLAKLVVSAAGDESNTFSVFDGDESRNVKWSKTYTYDEAVDKIGHKLNYILYRFDPSLHYDNGKIVSKREYAYRLWVTVAGVAS